MNEVLLAGLWQGALINAIAAAMTFAVPQRHAATRYSVWFSALVALAVLPFAALWHPSFSIVPPPVESTVVVTSAVTGRAADSGGYVLLFIWLSGVTFCAVRLALSHLRIRQIVRRAAPAPHLGADVLLSDELAMPISAGFVRGVVLIPRQIAQTLDADDLANVLRHERAHVTRHDVIGNLATLARDARSRAPLLTPSAIGSRRMLVGRITRLLNGKATQLKINYVTLTGTVATFALLGAALQTSNAIALASPPPASTSIVAVSSCDHPAKVLDPAAPTFPDVKMKVQRLSVNVLVTVAADGKMVSARIVKSSGNSAIDHATLEAARHSTYAPAMKDCKATLGQYVFSAKFNGGP